MLHNGDKLTVNKDNKVVLENKLNGFGNMWTLSLVIAVD